MFVIVCGSLDVLEDSWNALVVSLSVLEPWRFHIMCRRVHKVCWRVHRVNTVCWRVHEACWRIHGEF